MARSTFPSQNVQTTRGSDHFWHLRCRKSARGGGAKHISKSKVQETEGFGPLLEVQMSLRFVSLHYTTLHYTTLHYLPLHYTPLHYNYNYDYTTTLHYAKVHYTSPLTVPVWNGRTHAPYEMEKPTSFHTRPILENGAKNP